MNRSLCMNKILILVAFSLTGCLASVDAKELRKVASDSEQGPHPSCLDAYEAEKRCEGCIINRVYEYKTRELGTISLRRGDQKAKICDYLCNKAVAHLNDCLR